MSRAGRQSHAAHPQTNLILQYDDWQVKKTFLELFLPDACLQALHNKYRKSATDRRLPFKINC